MKKHRLRNKIKSIVGSKDEELKGSNIETEDNYKKILELVKEEDLEDKNKLVGLIEDFHKRYQSIYERYDHITGKLRGKIHLKKEEDYSSSSSSDSDLDSSSNKTGSEKELSMHESYKNEAAVKMRCFEQEEEEMLALLKKYKDNERESVSQIDHLTEKINSLQKELESFQIQVNEKQEQLESFSTQKLDSENQLEKRISDYLIQTDSLKLELASKTADGQKLLEEKDLYNEQMKDLEQEMKDLHSLKIELERKTQEIPEYLIQIQFLTEEVANKNGDQERLLSKVDDLESKLQSSAEEKKGLEMKITEMTEESRKGIWSKQQLVDQLEETIEDLRSDLEIKGDEVDTLTENFRNLEVKIRLLNQKIHITEQMLNEKENDHAIKEEKRHQENKSLMDKISTLSEIITSIKREVSEKVHNTLVGIDSLTVKFEEDYGHVQTRVYEIKNEIQAAQIHVKRLSSEKEELKERVGEIVMKLKVVEGENETLKKSEEKIQNGIVGKDEKIKELENMILVKDEAILDLGEEKREAIRQLCMLIDYQRDRHDHLHELLSKITTGGRQQTAR